MKTKAFRIPAEAIDPSLAPGHGGCMATDRITVDGRRVGFMYREEPDSRTDSGWRFFCGDEDASYVSDPDNLAIYEVNTIANYDPSIISLLGSPIGSAFQREAVSGGFVPATFPGGPNGE